MRGWGDTLRRGQGRDPEDHTEGLGKGGGGEAAAGGGGGGGRGGGAGGGGGKGGIHIAYFVGFF